MHDTSDSDDYPADADDEDEPVNAQGGPAAPVVAAPEPPVIPFFAPAPVADPVAPNAPVPARANRRGRSAGDASPIVVPPALLHRHAVSSLLDARHGSSGRLDVPSAAQIEAPAPNDVALVAPVASHSHDAQIDELADELLALTASTDAPIITDPLSVEAAMQTPQAVQWKAAMQAEIEALNAAGTYELAPLPPGHRAIGCKWVLKTKRNAAGAVVKYKARLVAKGFAQRYGIDYEETYAPVCRIGSIRVLIALAAHFDWHIHHMDVTSAFLNGDLEEVVYMRQPPTFEASGAQADLVCKLKKSLLRSQASRSHLEPQDRRTAPRIRFHRA